MVVQLSFLSAAYLQRPNEHACQASVRDGANTRRNRKENRHNKASAPALAYLLLERRYTYPVPALAARFAVDHAICRAPNHPMPLPRLHRFLPIAAALPPKCISGTRKLLGSRARMKALPDALQSPGCSRHSIATAQSGPLASAERTRRYRDGRIGTTHRRG